MAIWVAGYNMVRLPRVTRTLPFTTQPTHHRGLPHGFSASTVVATVLACRLLPFTPLIFRVLIDRGGVCFAAGTVTAQHATVNTRLRETAQTCRILPVGYQICEKKFSPGTIFNRKIFLTEYRIGTILLWVSQNRTGRGGEGNN